MFANHSRRIGFVELIQQRIQFHGDAQRPTICVHDSTTQRIPHMPSLPHNGQQQCKDNSCKNEHEDCADSGNLGLSRWDHEGSVDESAAVLNGQPYDKCQGCEVDGVKKYGGGDVSHRADMDFSAQIAHELDGFPFGSQRVLRIVTVFSEVCLCWAGEGEKAVRYSPIAGPLLSSMAPRSVKFS
jgi:hypothetical protein